MRTETTIFQSSSLCGILLLQKPSDNYVEEALVTIIDKNSLSPTSPPSLSLHLEVALHLTAAEARRRVNRQVVVELGTGLIARDPEELVIAGEQIAWRVPIWLAVPRLGDLGQVGTVDVDARTGEVLTNDQTKDKITQYATWLYQTATLPAE